MRRRDLPALASPLLVVLGLQGLLLRQGSDRLQALPALLIGVALLGRFFGKGHGRGMVWARVVLFTLNGVVLAGMAVRVVG